MLLTAICHDLLGFGPLEPLLKDKSITEIMVNGAWDHFYRTQRKETSVRSPV